MTTLHIVERRPEDLRENKSNARTHSPKQIQQIVQSIKSFGFNNPILIDKDGEIIAGHGRTKAAMIIGMATVPTVQLSHLTPAQKRAYVIADNRLAELAGWDKDILAIELQGLLDIDLDFAISDIGFEMPEIDLIVAGETVTDGDDPADALPLADQIPSVARKGDLWLLGKHRLFCGDALDPWSFKALLGREQAQMVFTDPPYNVPIAGHVSGLGKVEHGDFVMACGEMSPDQFSAFLRHSLQLAVEASMNGSLHFVCMDWRHLPELFTATSSVYTETKNLCVWVKRNAGMGSLYRSQHELVGVFKSGTGKHINNIELGRHGRNRSNIWNYAGMNSFQAGREDALAMHPTLKPIGMIADAIYDCSHRDGIILDPFAGAGSTLLAAERTGRRGYAIELDPHFVDVTLYRFVSTTGIHPIHAATGAIFDTPHETSSPAKARKQDAQPRNNSHGR